MASEIDKETFDSSNTEKSEDLFKKMSLQMADLMINSLTEKVSKLKGMITQIESSTKEDKTELIKKLNELISNTEEIMNKMKIQNETQLEIIKLTDKRKKIEEEVDKLLLK